MQIHWVILGSMENNLLEEIEIKFQVEELRKWAQRWYVAAEFLQKIWWVSLSFSLSKLCEEDEMNSGDQGVVFILILTEFPREKW